jgi:hypothetical protein
MRWCCLSWLSRKARPISIPSRSEQGHHIYAHGFTAEEIALGAVIPVRALGSGKIVGNDLAQIAIGIRSGSQSRRAPQCLCTLPGVRPRQGQVARKEWPEALPERDKQSPTMLPQPPGAANSGCLHHFILDPISMTSYQSSDFLHHPLAWPLSGRISRVTSRSAENFLTNS